MLNPTLNIERDHVFGWKFAPLELVEYGDFQCEYCAAVYPEVKLLQKVMGNRMKFVYRHYPLPNIHPLTLQAAVASEFAALQNKFWEMHDLIFENQKYLTRASLFDFARKIEMDSSLMEDTRTYKKMSQKVISDFESGVRSNVNETPTFFINGLRYNGMNDFEGLYKACNYTLLLIEAELKQPEQN